MCPFYNTFFDNPKESFAKKGFRGEKHFLKMGKLLAKTATHYLFHRSGTFVVQNYFSNISATELVRPFFWTVFNAPSFTFLYENISKPHFLFRNES